MITMYELVKDPSYEKFLTTKPELPAIMRSQKSNASPPWVVYVQREAGGKWGKKEFWKYSEAFHFLKRAMRAGVNDAALNCKRLGFEPPSRFVRIRGKYVTGSDGKSRQATQRVPWKVRLPAGEVPHNWCRYCRRPTIFKSYFKHARLGSVDSSPRCCICGASYRIALSSSDSTIRSY